MSRHYRFLRPNVENRIECQAETPNMARSVCGFRQETLSTSGNPGSDGELVGQKTTDYFKDV